MGITDLPPPPELVLAAHTKPLPNDLTTHRVRVCRDHIRKAAEEVQRVVTKITDVDDCFLGTLDGQVLFRPANGSIKKGLTVTQLFLILKQLQWYLDLEWARFEEIKPENPEATRRRKQKQQNKKQKRKKRQKSHSVSSYTTPKRPNPLPRILRSAFGLLP